VYVRPCTKYPIHSIKACVAKQGDTVPSIYRPMLDYSFIFEILSLKEIANLPNNKFQEALSLDDGLHLFVMKKCQLSVPEHFQSTI
ncbi:hypothetical protein BpHYR1_019384, partial [Brachionus plicatilis]